MKKMEKMQNYVTKVNFWPKLLGICSCHGNAKNDGHTIIDISKFLRRMIEQPLNISAS